MPVTAGHGTPPPGPTLRGTHCAGPRGCARLFSTLKPWVTGCHTPNHALLVPPIERLACRCWIVPAAAIADRCEGEAAPDSELTARTWASRTGTPLDRALSAIHPEAEAACGPGGRRARSSALQHFEI